MAASKQQPVFMSEEADQALRQWFIEALQHPDVLTTLKGLFEATLKDVTLNLNEGKGKEKKNLKGPSAEQTTEKGNGKGKAFLTEAAKLALSEAGAGPDLIRFFDAWNGYAKALNNADPNRGGVKGLVNYFQRDPEKFDARFQQWLKKNPAPQAEPTPVAPTPPEDGVDLEAMSSAFEIEED